MEDKFVCVKEDFLSLKLTLQLKQKQIMKPTTYESLQSHCTIQSFL